jgi:hypothetical protein
MKISVYGNKILKWISSRHGGRLWTLFIQPSDLLY